MLLLQVQILHLEQNRKKSTFFVKYDHRSPPSRFSQVHILFSRTSSAQPGLGSSPHLRTSELPVGPGSQHKHLSHKCLNFYFSSGYFWERRRVKSGLLRSIDRLTFVPADNESEKQVNSFLPFPPPERPGQTERSGKLSAHYCRVGGLQLEGGNKNQPTPSSSSSVSSSS